METATSSQRGQHHSTTSATTSAAACTTTSTATSAMDLLGASCSIAVDAVKLMQAGPPLRVWALVQCGCPVDWSALISLMDLLSVDPAPSQWLLRSWLVLQTNQQLLDSTPVGRSARPTNWDADDQAQAVLETAESLCQQTRWRLPLSTGPCWPSIMQGDWFPEGLQQHRFIDSGLVDLSSGFLWVLLGTVHRNSLRVLYNAAGAVQQKAN